MFSKFFGEFALMLMAWCLVCMGVTVDGAGEIFHNGWLRAFAVLALYVPGVFLGGVAIGKAIREMHK